MRGKDELKLQEPSGLFIGSEPIGYDADRSMKDKGDKDTTDTRDKGDDDSSDKGDSDSTDTGDKGDDASDADGRD